MSDDRDGADEGVALVDTAMSTSGGLEVVFDGVAEGVLAGDLVARATDDAPALDGCDPRLQLLAATWLVGLRSAATRRAYGTDLAAWAAWLARHGVGDVTAARRVHVDTWARELLDAGAASSSTSRRLSALSAFYRHLVEHDIIGASPVVGVRRPRVDPDQTTTVGLSRDEARALLRAADEDTGRQQTRTAAAIRLLLLGGLRVDEVVSADVADLGYNRGHRTLRLVRKGGVRVAVPLAPVTTAAIDAYLDQRATDSSTSRAALGGPLLATRTGGRLDQAAVWHLVRRLARAAQIPSWDQLSPHSLRHTAITLALDSGASLRDVQDMAGHRDPRTTRRYDRTRASLDRHPTYGLATWLA